MVAASDVRELAKWAHRASNLERAVKRGTAWAILRQRRLRCRVVGCRNRDTDIPCSRCGAR